MQSKRTHVFISAAVTLLVFMVVSLSMWLFDDYIASFFLGNGASSTSTEGTYAFAQAKLLLFGFLSALVGLFCFFSFTQYHFRLRSEAIVRELASTRTLTEEQFDMLYDNSPIPYFLMNDVGAMQSPNKATLRFFGGTREECSVANIYHFILEQDQEGENKRTLLKSKIDGGVPVMNEELCMKTFSGKEQWVRFSVFSLPRTSSVPFRHVATLLDVTQERESEQMKTDFLLLASHQLRTPTTTIKWYTDYLLSLDMQTVGGVVREYLQEIYKGNERMMELIRTLLTVSRIEMGTLQPEYVPVHMRATLDDVLAELAPNIQQRNTKVHVESAGDDKIVTDTMMVRVAVHNLLTNAIKYTPEGGDVSVVLSCTQKTCVLEVKDSGYGIPLAEQNKVFQKMFRAVNAKKISSHGTGLGLFLTKAFMEKLGGSIDFVSEEGKGTTFTLTLPRVAPGA